MHIRTRLGSGEGLPAAFDGTDQCIQFCYGEFGGRAFQQVRETVAEACNTRHAIQNASPVSATSPLDAPAATCRAAFGKSPEPLDVGKAHPACAYELPIRMGTFILRVLGLGELWQTGQQSLPLYVCGLDFRVFPRERAVYNLPREIPETEIILRQRFSTGPIIGGQARPPRAGGWPPSDAPP